MTGGSAEAVSLVWLREPAINDQVALLRYPRRTISGEVAGHITDIVGPDCDLQRVSWSYALAFCAWAIALPAWSGQC